MSGNSGLFHRVHDAWCIWREKGVTRQSEIYHRNDVLYIKAKGGFVKLFRDGSSVPSMIIVEVVGVSTQQQNNGELKRA